MGKLVVAEFLTLDGVLQAPGGEDEDRSDGFDKGGWQRPYFDDVFMKAVVDGINAADGYLLGRKTYDIFSAYWPTSSSPEERTVAEPLNSRPKYVASRTLAEPLKWDKASLVKGDVVREVAALKERENLMVMGSGELAQTLINANLVDEYSLMFHPLVLGKGKRLFREGGKNQTLRLLSSTTTSKGVVIARYQNERT